MLRVWFRTSRGRLHGREGQGVWPRAPPAAGVRLADDDSCVNRDPKTLLVGSGIVRWNGKSMYQEVTQCAWREIPVTPIYTSQDVTVPHDYQKSMVETMRAEGQEVDTVELATGHCPNVTVTKEVVDVVNHVVAEKIKP